MIVIKLREHLLHYGLPEKSCLCTYPELVTILTNGSHLAVIQIDHLPVTTHKGFLLLLQVLRVYACKGMLFLFGQFE